MRDYGFYVKSSLLNNINAIKLEMIQLIIDGYEGKSTAHVVKVLLDHIKALDDMRTSVLEHLCKYEDSTTTEFCEELTDIGKYLVELSTYSTSLKIGESGLLRDNLELLKKLLETTEDVSTQTLESIRLMLLDAEETGLVPRGDLSLECAKHQCDILWMNRGNFDIISEFSLGLLKVKLSEVELSTNKKENVLKSLEYMKTSGLMISGNLDVMVSIANELACPVINIDKHF